jgi:hypothetical protein
MNRKSPLLFLSLLLCLWVGGEARAQDPKELTVKAVDFYVYDIYGKPWSRLTDQVRIKLDPEFAGEFGATDISVPNTNFSFSTNNVKPYRLEKSSSGTYARVPWIVFKNNNNPVRYIVEVYDPQARRSVAWLRPANGKVERRNNSGGIGGVLREANSVGTTFFANWYIIAGVILLGALLIYFLILKWLFSGLMLRRRWGASSAQNFTLSLSILMMLAIIVGLALYFYGMRPETWIILGIMAALWLLHGVVWLVSGNKTA